MREREREALTDAAAAVAHSLLLLRGLLPLPQDECADQRKKKDWLNAYGLELAKVIPGNVKQRVDEAKQLGKEEGRGSANGGSDRDSEPKKCLFLTRSAILGSKKVCEGKIVKRLE